jgi:hypothetical protein
MERSTSCPFSSGTVTSRARVLRGVGSGGVQARTLSCPASPSSRRAENTPAGSHSAPSGKLARRHARRKVQGHGALPEPGISVHEGQLAEASHEGHSHETSSGLDAREELPTLLRLELFYLRSVPSASLTVLGAGRTRLAV